VTLAFAASPVVFWASDPIAPGETVLATGSGFGDTPKIEVLRLADGAAGDASSAPFAWSGQGQALKPLQPTPTCVKFTLPDSLKPGVFAYRITSPSGATSGLLNRPAIWWAQGDRGAAATPGGWLRLFGKNLAWRGAHGASTGENGPPTVVAMTGPRSHRFAAQADCYSARVDLPKDLPPGQYKLYAHNGRGGPPAWSSPVTISVLAPRPWPQTIFNVRDFGAQGDGVVDDTAAVRAALARADDSGGGIVYFPRGRYQVNDTLLIPRFTVLRGEKEDLVNILWPDMQAPPPALIKGANSFGIDNLTFYCSNYKVFLTSDTTGPDAGDVFLRHVRIRANVFRGHMTPEDVDKRWRAGVANGFGGGYWLVQLGGRNLEVTDCDLYSSSCPIAMTQPRGARVERNIIGLGRWGGDGIFGGDGVILADNHFLGCDLMSWGAAGGIGYANTEHVYIARNTFALEHGGDRESITSDASGGIFHGHVASADASSITLPAPPKGADDRWIGAAVYIIDGTGRGQWRRTKSFDGARVFVDRPWDIIPDTTSIASIVWLLHNWLILDNEFSDVGICIQLYGAAIDHICAGNVSSRSAGFHNFGMDYYGIQPSWYIQWLGNEIREGNSYNSGHDNYMLSGEAHLGIFALPPGPQFNEPITMGCVARGNHLRSNAHIAVGGTDPYNAAFGNPNTQDVIVENNDIADSDIGIFVRRASTGVLLRNNRFTRVREPIRDEVAVLKAQEERRQAILAGKGPIAAWSFDEVKGPALPDATGHGFDARVTGKLTLVPGHKGNAAQFQGQSWLVVNEPVMFNLDNLTLSLWIKPDTIQGRHALMGKRFAGTAAPYIISLWDGGIEFEANDEQGKWSFNFRTPAVVKVGEWSHVAAVVDRGKGVAIYVNGALVGHYESTLGRTMNSEPLVLGREAWDGVNLSPNPCFYQGLMDEAKVWGRALTPDEIRAESIAH
jgi:hypothetical protein